MGQYIGGRDIGGRAEIPNKGSGWPVVRTVVSPSSGPDYRPSDGHIRKLWEFRSLLMYRAERARGLEGQHLLSQVEGLDQSIAHCLGKDASDIQKLNDIHDLKVLLNDRS